MKAVRMNLGRRLQWLWLVGWLALASVSSGQEVPKLQWKTDYTKAHQQRISENRPMLVFITMDGCHFCERMMKTTYADSEVARQIQSDFVPTYIDGERQNELARQFRVRVFPTTYLIAADNRVVDRIEGYISADDFKSRIRNAVNASADARGAQDASKTR